MKIQNVTGEFRNRGINRSAKGYFLLYIFGLSYPTLAYAHNNPPDFATSPVIPPRTCNDSAHHFLELTDRREARHASDKLTPPKMHVDTITAPHVDAFTTPHADVGNLHTDASVAESHTDLALTPHIDTAPIHADIQPVHVDFFTTEPATTEPRQPHYSSKPHQISKEKSYSSHHAIHGDIVIPINSDTNRIIDISQISEAESLAEAIDVVLKENPNIHYTMKDYLSKEAADSALTNADKIKERRAFLAFILKITSSSQND